MFRSSRRLLVAALATITLTGSLASAAEIRLKSGVLYSNATILSRSATSVEVQVQYGRMTVPLSLIATIDGQRIVAPLPTAAPMAPVRPTAKPGFSASPIPARAGSAVTPVSATASPTTAHAAALAGEPTSKRWIWLTLLILGGVGVWAWTVFLVRGDLAKRNQPGRFWWVLATALPGVGYLAYQISVRATQRWTIWHQAKERQAFQLLDADQNPIEIREGEEVTGIENAKEILRNALRQRASDVHIEPFATECRVRYRIDGTLYQRAKINLDAGLRLVSAIKTLSQIDIAERRKAQDGRFGARTGTRSVDFRVATTPSVYGEKLVIRVLDLQSGMRGLQDIGMPEAMMKRFERAIHSRSGMILATGPTGSGKTSTLYAALSQLDSVQLNLVTIEDPVEYELPGATQIPVNVKAGVTYEAGLRSILRQDPDVILVGEMRDLEAAQIALRSALTGHLVFSSLHTRDAIGTLSRLEEMGIERHLLASALFVVIAQRLVRVLCRNCREPYPCVGNELEELGFELPEGETIYRATGCRKCEGTGYIGRTGVFEMLVLDDILRTEVNNGLAEESFTKLARSKGYQGYREEAAQKILLGITSVDEVIKAS